jgi:hypothetical protein
VVFKTRRISRNAPFGSAIEHSVNVMTAVSIVAVSIGSDSAAAWMRSIVVPASFDRPRASWSSSGDGSMATTRSTAEE